MNSDQLFCHLSSDQIAGLIRSAEGSVCYAGPGISLEPAAAMVEVAKRIGPELLTVSLDFDERVMRMGYGDMDAVRILRGAGVHINHAPGLRSALIIVDSEGYTFTPTPLYLEAESSSDDVRNALRLTSGQVAEALARLSPAAKAIAIALTSDPEKKAHISNLPVEVGSHQIDQVKFDQVDTSLKEAPPVKFDLARQVRVFESYLQYVELKLTGAAIQRLRLTIPDEIQRLGGSNDIKGRLHTTFDLIENDSKISSKALEGELREIRNNLTPSLGKNHGRVVLKSNKPHLMKRLQEFRKKLVDHQIRVGEDLERHLNESRKAIIDHYLPKIMQSPRDAVLGQSHTGAVTWEGARKWLDGQLNRAFPNANSLIDEMQLDEQYKDVTYETLNRSDFLTSVKEAFPYASLDWDKAHEEFRAAGEGNDNHG